MLLQKVEKRWETRPLDCWAKAKELRAKYIRDEVSASLESKILVEGMDSTTPAGIPQCHCTFSQPYGASMAVQGDDFARQCRAITEGHGYGRDLCGYMLNQYGGMFSDQGLTRSRRRAYDYRIIIAGAANSLFLKSIQPKSLTHQVYYTRIISKFLLHLFFSCC